MSIETKISPAFEPFLSNSGPKDKREAIVIYQSAQVVNAPLHGRLRELKQRLDAIAERAYEQRRIEEKLSADYQRASAKQLPSQQKLSVSPIGGSALPIATFEVTRLTLTALAERPEVIAILPNQRIDLIQPKQVAYSKLTRQENSDGLTWGLKHLGIPDLWKTTKGADINVAVLDTGVYGDHPALRDRVKDFIVIDPIGRRIKPDRSFDGAQHGTHVCGTICGGKTLQGVSIGVAPEANLFVAAVLIGNTTLRTLLEGITWAVERGADIINMSLSLSYYEPLFAEVFQILINQYGVMPVVAIGNENHGNTRSPGNAYNAFSVGAVEKLARGKTSVAAFSCGASLVFPGQEPNALVTKPDIVAPGVQIYSCIPTEKRVDGAYEYAYFDGTSMATPHISGVAALLMAARPETPVSTIMKVLRDTAKHPDGIERRPDNRWGYGFIQPTAALDALN